MDMAWWIMLAALLFWEEKGARLKSLLKTIALISSAVRL